MLPPRKILFAADLSEGSRRLARTVCRLAQRSNAEVEVLHTFELGPHDAYAAKADEAGQEMSALIAGELADCNVALHLVPGDPARAIVDMARKGGADLIMMPTRGQSVWDRSLTGSITARVLHDAPCPVWTSTGRHTNRAAHRDHGIKTILCAVDFGPRSALVLHAAMQVAQWWQASVRLANVIEITNRSTQADWTRESRDQITADVERQLRQLAEGVGGEPIIEVLAGSPVTEVTHAAERCHADLIVLGRTQVLEGEARPSSTAYDIIAASHCAVLSV